MGQDGKGRTTRSKAIGRFRQERRDNYEADLRERQSALLSVAERVVEIADQTHTTLDDTRSGRKEWGDQMRDDLDTFSSNLAQSTKDKLTGTRQLRAASGEVDKNKRLAFVNDWLRPEVERIRTDDFR